MTCANSLNPIVSIEYGENGLQFGQIYNKMENVWVNLHHLQKGEYIVNLVGYYNLVNSNEEVILALIVRFKVVQNMLTMLKMKGIHVAQGTCSCLYEPWEVEKVDPKHLAYDPPTKTIVGEDGNCEGSWDCAHEPLPPLGVKHIGGNLVDDDINNVVVM